MAGQRPGTDVATANSRMRNLLPKELRSGSRSRGALSIFNHLMKDFGWWRAGGEQACIDRHGNPIPWFTYPAIEYLSQLDYSEKSVFEWGSGYSTMFWSRLAKAVVSIETDPSWAEIVQKRVGANATVVMSTREIRDYCNKIMPFAGFDIIVIDGTGESRRPCAELAVSKLNRGGMIILDNSDLWPGSAGVLRAANLIQIDFAGFVPLASHCQTTSVFLSRDFDFVPLNGTQPKKSVGQPAEPWPGE